MSIDIGISEIYRKAVVELLNRLLADEFTLYGKARNSTIGMWRHPTSANWKNFLRLSTRPSTRSSMK